jgi:hypothetical protein
MSGVLTGTVQRFFTESGYETDIYKKKRSLRLYLIVSYVAVCAGNGRD